MMYSLNQNKENDNRKLKIKNLNFIIDQQIIKHQILIIFQTKIKINNKIHILKQKVIQI